MDITSQINMEVVVDWLTGSGVRIVVILVIALIAYRLLGTLTAYLNREIQELDDEDGSVLDKRTDTIFRVVRSSGIVLIVGTAVLMILTEVGVPIAPVLASVGVVGLAFGLGAQTLVKDVISGLFVLIENQYTVGDVVEVTGLVGTVEEMTLRATMIRDLYGTIHIVPNGEIRVVSNKSRDWSRAIVDVGITYETDVDLALQTLEEIGSKLRVDEEYGLALLEDPLVTGIESLDDWAIRLRFMVKTLPNEQWGVQRYLRQQINEVFQQKGIDLAFPRQDLMFLNPESSK